MHLRLRKLMAVMLTASMCVPTVSGISVQAATPAAIFTDAETIPVNQIVSQRDNLFNSDWKFFLGKSDSAQNPDFNDADWRSVDLPHDFSIEQNFTSSGEAESGFLPGGTGWYRKSFSLPSSLKDKTIVMNFEGAYNQTYLYVNGQKVGENHYGYNNFAFDISDYLICDGSTQNVISVKVDHPTPSSRWYSGSGIYRDVKLIVTDPVHIALNGTYVTTPNIETGDGTAKVEVEVDNDTDSAKNVMVRSTIYDAEGVVASDEVTQELTIQANASAKATLSPAVVSPELWSVTNPNLYSVRSEILVDGEVVDTYDTTFGYRWFKFEQNTGFQLNGQPVKINGVCMHHDQGALGSAAYYDALYRQLSKMKEMGANAIRITHNPQTSAYLEICNKLGLLAVEEFYDGWNLAKNGNSQDFSLYFDKKLTADNHLIDGDSSMSWSEFALKSVVKRDRSNPSLIMWSLGNEVQEGASSGADFPQIAARLAQWAKEVDPTRPATIGGNNKTSTGILGNVYNAVRDSGGVVGFNYANSGQMESLHQSYPLIIASETSSSVNSRGIYNSQSSQANADGKYHLTSYDTSAVGWGKTAANSMWDTLRYDFIAGEFIWTGFDYIGEPTPWNGTGVGDGGRGAIPNSSYFGIVETTGFEKDPFYLYTSQWREDDSTTLHLVTAWDSNNMINNNGKTPVWVYSNAPKVELYRDGNLIGTATRRVNTTDVGHKYYTYTTASSNLSVCTTNSGSNAASLYSVFDVAYQAGTISAKAFDENGNEITDTIGTSEVSTPGTASKLQVSQNVEEIDADGASLAYVTVDLTDAAGNLNTKATNKIQFSLEGNGVIMGVDNGDQATTKKYQQKSVLTSATTANINAYAGKALVIVKSTKYAGNIDLTVSSEGMEDQTVSITTVKTKDSMSDGIVSYTISKHCYVPVGTASLSLPVSVSADYSDGTKKDVSVKWDDYDKDSLNKQGIFKVSGTLQDEKNPTPVSMNVHVYNPIVSAKSISGITAPNTIPTLPGVAMTYTNDGSAFEEFPITWNNESLTEELFATVNDVVTINGTVQALDTTMPITANYRVAEPVYGDHSNIAPEVSDLTESCTNPSDNLQAIIDGCRFDDNTRGESNRWTNWNTKGNSDTPYITMKWDTAHLVDQINLYYYTDSNVNSQLPTSVKFQYSLNGNDFIDIEHEDAQALPSDTTNSVWTDRADKGYSYQLKEAVNPIAVRVLLGHDAGKFVGLTEMEVISTNISYEMNSAADLQNFTVGNTAVSLGTDDTYEIDETSFDNIKFDNSNNASVTIIPISKREVKVVATSEDGSQTKSFRIILKNVSIDPEPEKPEPEKPGTENPEPENPEPENPGTENPGTEKPGTENPGTGNPGTGNPNIVPDKPVSGLQTGQRVTVKNIEYKVLNASAKTVMVVKGTKKKVTSVTIPNTVKINGVSCKVVQIGSNAFKKFTSLKKVTIGKNVTSIMKNSFAFCKKLSRVKFKGTVKTIKSGAFKKTSKKMVVSVPKKISKNKKKAASFKKMLKKSGMSRKLKLK